MRLCDPRDPVGDFPEPAERNGLRFHGWRKSKHGDRPPRQFVKDCACDAWYRVFAQPRLRAGLHELCQDAEFRELVADARVYYVNEAAMAHVLGLPQGDQAAC